MEPMRMQQIQVASRRQRLKDLFKQVRIPGDGNNCMYHTIQEGLKLLKDRPVKPVGIFRKNLRKYARGEDLRTSLLEYYKGGDGVREAGGQAYRSQRAFDKQLNRLCRSHDAIEDIDTGKVKKVPVSFDDGCDEADWGNPPFDFAIVCAKCQENEHS